MNASQRLLNASDEGGCDETPVNGEVRNVVLFHGRPRLDHALHVALRRLEQKCFLSVAIDDPGMLPACCWPVAAKDASDEELGFDADLNQLSPRPQGEIFAVAALAPLEVTWLLPEVRFVELVDIRNVFA